MNKLQKVTDKICELLKGTELDQLETCEVLMGGTRFATIREAEVLMALGGLYTIDGGGCIYEYCDNRGDNETYACLDVEWNLGKPLQDQSPETIEFLFNVLNCK